MSVKKKKTVKDDEKRSPGFFSKLIFLWVIPFVYAIGLGMVLLQFAGVSFDTQINWVQDHTKFFWALYSKHM